MNYEWYYGIVEVFQWFHYYFYNGYRENVGHTFIQLIMLTGLCLFTPGIIGTNLLFVGYINHLGTKNWLKHILFIFLGKLVGFYVIIVVASLGDQHVLKMAEVFRSYGSILIIGGIIYLMVKMKDDLKYLYLVSTGIGILSSLLIGPLQYSYLKLLPLDISSFLEAAFLMFLLFLPIIVYRFILFGFNLDSKVNQGFMRYINVALITIVFINELILYWL